MSVSIEMSSFLEMSIQIEMSFQEKGTSQSKRTFQVKRTFQGKRTFQWFLGMSSFLKDNNRKRAIQKSAQVWKTARQEHWNQGKFKNRPDSWRWQKSNCRRHYRQTEKKAAELADAGDKKDSCWQISQIPSNRLWLILTQISLLLLLSFLLLGNTLDLRWRKLEWINIPPDSDLSIPFLPR